MVLLSLALPYPTCAGNQVLKCCCIAMVVAACSERAEDIYRIVAHHLGVPLVEVSSADVGVLLWCSSE